MTGRRPYRVHVHDIGPNFSFSTKARADELARRLVSGEEWDAGAKGRIGNYAKVTVSDHDSFDDEAGILLRRWIYIAGETVAGRPPRVEVFRRGVGWEPEYAEEPIR